MVVVQINSECGFGSTGKIVCSISKLMSDKGIENYIFYSGNHKSNFKNSIRINGKFNIRIHQLLSRLFGDQGFHSYFSTKRLVRKIEKIQPDAILLHNLHGYYLHSGVLFKFLKKYNRPVYWTLHDCWAFTGHCSHFMLAGCDKWKEKCNNCNSVHKYPFSWFFDRSEELFVRKKDLFTGLDELTIITPSQWLSSMVSKSFLQKYPCVVINNGIDLGIFKQADSDFRQKHNINNEKILLGVASIWCNQKGLDIFTSLARTQKEWKIVLVGTDDNIDKILPPEIISIHRTTNQKELVKIYSAADVFVNPTREDTYPTVNMEAIACNTPVVTFDTGGSGEIVANGCGIVCKSNTLEDMKANISLVLNDSSFSQQCVTYREELDEAHCFLKYYDLICKQRKTW